MKSIIYSLIIISLYNSCQINKNNNPRENENHEPINDSLIYKNINYLLCHKGINPDLEDTIILSKQSMPFPFYFKNDSILLTQLDTLFSKADIEFIFSQKKQFEKFVINPIYIKNKIVVSSDSSIAVKSYSTISYPLFNLKKNIIIVRTSYYCGVFCGHQGVYIYKWMNNELVLIKVIQQDVY